MRSLLIILILIASPAFAQTAPVSEHEELAQNIAQGGGVSHLDDFLVSEHEELAQNIAGQLMCLCGCKSTLATCPHTDCGFAIPANKLILDMLNKGQTKDQVVAFFVEREGEVMLAQPPKKGFNLVGYIFPFVVILFAGYLIARILGAWTKRGEMKHAPAGATAGNRTTDDSYSERIKNELSDYEE